MDRPIGSALVVRSGRSKPCSGIGGHIPETGTGAGGGPGSG